MHFSERVTTAATRHDAWSAVTAVTTWPQWTASMRDVRPLGPAGIAVGNRYQVTQPGLPRIVWEVTEVRDGESWVWASRSPGVRTVAYHRVAATPDGGTEIAIGIDHGGPLGWLVGVLTAAKTRRFLALEAAGLKAASEAAGRPAG
jgi:polyketide cyclase/dehydrase/lipid transport protein